MTINYQPAIDAGVITHAQAEAFSVAIQECDGVTCFDLGLLTDDEFDALDRFVVWWITKNAQ